jgi:hypothetical protein
MSDTAETPVSPDDDKQRRRQRVYLAAARDPGWAVSHLLTEAVGTLRAVVHPDHPDQYVRDRAAEALAEIDRMVDEKLGGDDAQR